MTKTEIKAALDLAGVSLHGLGRKPKLADLQALYDNHMLAEHEANRNAEAESQPILEPDTGAEGPGDQNQSFSPETVERAEQDNIPAILDQIIEDMKPIDFATATAEEVADANCPHCGVHLSNGLLHMQDEALHEGGSYTPARTLYEDGQQNYTWSCMGCGEGFGTLHEPYVAPTPGTGIKIEKDRVEQNGIKRPSVGGKCRAIWDALDAYRAETGELPTSKVVKELAADEGWNPNNASIEYYQWRKFNGITKG